MAVRPIDGNELYRIEKLLDTDIVRQDKVALNLLEQVLYDIQHVPTLTPPNEPLTVEQLRGTPHGKIKDKTLQHICDRANELAYAYPTAHIDREKWEPCDACSNAKHIVGLALAIMDDGSDHRIDTKMNCEYSFCPNCGRPLTDEAWAELERRVCGEV